jgi:hypothetical protein
MSTTPKYFLPTSKGSHFRLTLTAQALSLAIQKNSKWAGIAANLRTDGKWDTLVPMSSMSLLKQLAEPNENLSDTVVRILSTSGTAAKTGGQSNGN